MDATSIIIALIIGAIAGWLAGVVVKGGGFGLIGDIIVGIVGSFIAGYLFPRLDISLGGGFIGAVIASAIGAIILLVIIKLIRRVRSLTRPSKLNPGLRDRDFCLGWADVRGWISLVEH